MTYLAVAAAFAAGVAGALIAYEVVTARGRRRTSQMIAKRMRGSPAAAGGNPAASSRTAPRTAGIAGFLRCGKRAVGPGEVESHLPELIDVVCLGIEGGMTFEAAFGLYTDRFDTALARACRPAALLMRSGVEGRETVLRGLAGELGCRSFTRFVEISLRSIRFGARLAPLLRELADEVRESRSARSEEAIAKAPTKMLVPTGLLILPAMLLLVAGPFLLELLNQM